MRRLKGGRKALDVRAKLLWMLGVLSLPLLIVSLYQLHGYRKALADQSASVARVEAEAAAAALESWVETHPAQASGAHALSVADAAELYARVGRRMTTGQQKSFAVFDPSGRIVLRPDESSAAPEGVPEKPRQVLWSDGVSRATGAARAYPSGWSVAVGMPEPDGASAGQSIALLAAAWALALGASCLLAVWAVGRFTKPLRSLASSATSLGEGDLRARARVETDDEVGTLAESFNSMAGSLEAKFEAVKRQSAFIGEVLDSLPLGVVVLDAKLIVRKVNSSFAQVAGRGASALTGRGLYEASAGLAVLSDVVEEVRRTRRAFVSYGQPLELAAREEGDGAQQKFWDVIVWPVTEQSEGRGDLILLLSEVSKRVRAERLATAAFAAEKSRAAELASVISQMDEGVVIVGPEGRYRLNPSAARILGRRAGEFSGGIKALVVDLTLRDMEGRVLAAEKTPICRAFSKAEHVSGERCKVTGRDGEERVISVSATPLAGEGGRTEGVVAVFRDVTEDVRRHDELLSAYERLREHDRLKSAFVANMSHELRTPLNVIIGLCQLLARDPSMPLAPLQSEALARMERNGRALLELVNDMLEYSRLEAGRSALMIETLRVEEVVNAVVEDFASDALAKNIELRSEVSEELGRVRTDRRKLKQVLSCLVSNAVKFTSAGHVGLKAGLAGGDRWYIEVSDTGIGISGDELAFIFDDFRQGDERLARSYNGVGLGLALTRKIVELLEGEIEVESRPSEGSRFRITWPREARPRTGTGSLVMQQRPREDGARRLRAV